MYTYKHQCFCENLMLSVLHGAVLERLTVSELIRNLSNYYGTGKVITIVTRNHHMNILLHIIWYQCILLMCGFSIHFRQLKLNDSFVTFQKIYNTRPLYCILLPFITWNRKLWKIWRCVYRASYCNVLISNEIHNSYIHFYSTVFCLLYVFRKSLVVHHQEHGIMYCITQFGTIV